MRITITNFSGVSPKSSPLLLQNNQAQVANNARLWTGTLEPLPVASSVKTGVGGAVKSIYRFGQDIPGDTDHWFTWSSDVHVVKGPIAGDTSERTYFTGSGFPRVTDNSIALGSQPYPGASYKLGVPAPFIAPFVTVNGPDPTIPTDTTTGGAGTDTTTATTTETAETRAYVYTYVSAWGEEGQPSDPTLVELYPSTQTATLTLGSIPTGGYNLATARIYRSLTSTSGTNYFFIAEIPISQTSFTDNYASTSLGEPIPSLTWAMPPESLKGLIAMPNGFLAGFTGQDIYFSEAYRLHAWPVEYMQSVDYPVVGLGQFGQSLVVLTTGSPYLLTGTDPSAMTLEKLDFEQSCVSARSISRLGSGVAWASPDGLAYIGPDGMSVITDGLFTRKEWQALNPSSIIGAQHDNRYYGFYDSGNKAGFIFDPKNALAPFVFTSQYYIGLYNDLRNDALYGVYQGTISKIEGGASLLTYTWRSKKFSLPKPMSLSAWQVIASDYANLTIKFYLDGTLILSTAVTSAEVRRLPAVIGRTLEIEMTGTSTVAAVHVSDWVEELRNV